MTHRRGNGLLADAYVPLILLPPALADVMLDALRRAGIAAYAIPLDEDVLEPGGAALREPPTDHLYVDANERHAAEEILRTELPDLEAHTEPGGEPADRRDPRETGTAPAAGTAHDAAPAGDPGDDDVWADLVSRFYEPGAPGRAAPEWPDAENLSAGESPPLADRTGRDEPGLLDDLTGDTPGPAGPAPHPTQGRADDHDHFVPPPPPPLPRGDLVSRLSWAGLFGGPVLLLTSTMLSLNIPGWLAFCAVAAFIAGFVVLVVRMGDRPPRDSGPDDGAVL
ncbi:hypothetical protein [Marinactinospora rubrisoli]|uniref:DUF2007 domain-containing protein n=1 Tax=Marinactinospora rubrisoli TaxID=2715399 RepID=A0ABW2KLZ3_9ACTN